MSESSGEGWRREALWLGIALVTVLLAALVPLLFYQRYYFIGDSQVSYFGRFYHFGEMLRQGHWPMLNPSAWRSGDYLLESSWGLFSPVMMVIGVMASLTHNALSFMTAYKLVFLLLLATGTYVLARSFRVGPPLSAVTAVSVTVGGFTSYFDAESWAVGLMASALMTWTWWGLRRLLAGRNPAWALVFGVGVATLGYVSATLWLAALVAAHLAEAALRRDWRGLVRVLAAGACFGLVAVTVHLPGLLSAGVTSRSGTGIHNTGILVADPGGLLSAVLPTQTAAVSGWWGPVSSAPAMYISWLLPLVLLVDRRRAITVVRQTAALWLLLGVSVLWVLGPSNLGPIRDPLRTMPYVVLTSLLGLSLLLSRARLARVSSGRLVAMLLWELLAVLLSVSLRPDRWQPALAGAVVVGIGLAILWWLLQRRPGGGGMPAVAAVFAVVWSVLLVAVQHHYFPKGPAGEFNMPARVAAYHTQLGAAVGDTFVVGPVGGVVARRPSMNEHLLLANSWYVNEHSVQNVYSAIGYRAYNNRYCFNFQGTTCPEALDTLFSVEPRTGLARVDLLAVSTVTVLRSVVAEADLKAPPPGWHQAGTTPVTLTWVRDEPVPGAGGVVWQSPGTSVEVLDRDTTTVRLRVRQVSGQGGTVVLSRLKWPGYQVTNASLAAPVDDYLVTLDVPADSAGSTVVLEFQPPGWRLEQAALFLALGGGLLWSAMAAALSRRRRRGYDVPHSA